MVTIFRVSTATSATVTSAIVALCACISLAAAEPLFTENFNGYADGNQNSLQVATGLRLTVGGSLPGWEKAGTGTVHAVDRTAAGDYAPMIWVDNVLTLRAGIAANERGKTYVVEFEAGPTVYADGSQTTGAADGLVIEVLRSDDSALARHTHRPGAWNSAQKFARDRFQYVGDGGGAVRLRVRPLLNDGRFGGAIDNLSLSLPSKESQHFDLKIAPLFASHCLQCHSGPKPEGGLDLSRQRKALAGGESGPAISPGDPDASLLWARVEADEMPPKHPLNAEEKRLLQDWIRRGAVWGNPSIDPFQFSSARRAGYDWWSLQPLKKIDPPPIKQKKFEAWAKNEVDHFILAKLADNKLSPSPRADARVLVRRLAIDLTGLPPSAEMIEKFAADPSDQAWEKLVDELLASPHYGERWAQHWLDVVRFGESDGYEYNSPRDASWHYRDWVIRALNDDLPFDEFARLQLAGDVLKPDTLEGKAASGFLVAGVHNTVVGASPAMRQLARHDELEDLTATISQTFLGLTVNCARCHDHKFDPISTQEYYQFVAAIAGVNHGRQEVRSARNEPTAIYSVVSSNPGPMHVLLRGSVTSPGDEVSPHGLLAIKNVSPDFNLGSQASDAQRRTQLANWITSGENAPFQRVIVNRIWHHHFGKGIVETPSDLGFNGARPTHPELLDWLAGWFRDHGYSLKQLHKLIVMSAAYQQASRSSPASEKVDASNRFLWRQNPRRVEAEVLRDSMLEIAGELNREQFGPGFKDVRIEKVEPTFYYLPIDPIGAEFNRRTIYRWNVRGERSALLDSFDCPDPSTRTPNRSVTTTPSQALSQWNHSFVLRMAEKLAQRVTKEVAAQNTAAETADEKTDLVPRQVEHAWRLTLGRAPTAEEKAKAIPFARERGLPLLCRVLLNCNEFVIVD